MDLPECIQKGISQLSKKLEVCKKAVIIGLMEDLHSYRANVIVSNQYAYIDFYYLRIWFSLYRVSVLDTPAKNINIAIELMGLWMPYCY